MIGCSSKNTQTQSESSAKARRTQELMRQLDSEMEEVSLSRCNGLTFRQGYEKLCCVRCVATRDMNFQGSTCICRVPKANLKKGIVVECPHCGRSLELGGTDLTGCRGCASSD